MTDAAEQIAALSTACATLGAKDQDFASSLIRSLQRYGQLSPKQQHWAGVLIERAANPAPARETVTLGEFGPMITMFDRAQVRWPKVRLNVEGLGEIEISKAGERSRFPGTLNVATPGGYGNNTWFGRILTDGRFEMSPRHRADTALVTILTRFAAEPAVVAAEYGRLTGRCCACNRPLSTPTSVALGYGPDCAKKWGWSRVRR